MTCLTLSQKQIVIYHREGACPKAREKGDRGKLNFHLFLGQGQT